ncbi:hypothetical protein AB0J21_18350 [Streptomyces sp. NPDC049954]|uniref:hypothetical protein n=1 Tax=Streptomyces sp. NPDC049954 TaxID=3155779 RepID=UPI00343B8EF2
MRRSLSLVCTVVLLGAIVSVVVAVTSFSAPSETTHRCVMEEAPPRVSGEGRIEARVRQTCEGGGWKTQWVKARILSRSCERGCPNRVVMTYARSPLPDGEGRVAEYRGGVACAPSDEPRWFVVEGSSYLRDGEFQTRGSSAAVRLPCGN